MSPSLSSQHIDVVVIGGGQAGLAMSACLRQASVDHVVLERGAVANSWRTERWDSLRLLTPNWLSRLPGYEYAGPDPDGFMTAAEVVRFLAGYASAAPIVEHAPVELVQPIEGGHLVVTPGRAWKCRAVVVATGACSSPRIPAVASALPSSVHQLTPINYRNPDALPDGDVLVVGASASGAQIADELARTGRSVTIAVGSHIRLPRTYRGMDIHWWLDQAGVLDERWTDVDDITKARRAPSLQLVGSADQRDLGVRELSESGVRVVGRLAGADGHHLQCSGGLANQLRSADLKQNRLLDRLDEHAHGRGLDAEIGDAMRPEPTPIPEAVLALESTQFSAVVWATGFRTSIPFLPPNHTSARGALRHDGGVLDEPGLYVLGMPFQRRRSSAFIDGVGRDAEELMPPIREHLNRTAPHRSSAA